MTIQPLEPLENFGAVYRKYWWGEYPSGKEREYELAKQDLEAQVAHLDAQLLARGEVDKNVWGSDPKRIEFGRFLCSLGKEALHWPSDSFIPDDPTGIFLYGHHPIDGLCIVVDIEEHLSLEISDEEMEAWYEKTLGELVDYLLIKQDSGNRTNINL